DPQLYFDKIYTRISAGTKGWLNEKAKLLSLFGEKNSEIVLNINGGEVILQRDTNFYASEQSYNQYQPDRKIINDSVLYLNWTKLAWWDMADTVLPQAEKSKSIICDLRGYPTQKIHNFMSYFINDDDKSKSDIKFIQYPCF